MSGPSGVGREASAAGTLDSLLMLFRWLSQGCWAGRRGARLGRGVRVPHAAGSSCPEDQVMAACSFIFPYSTCYVCVLVTQSGPTLCNPMDSSVHGILQARILE